MGGPNLMMVRQAPPLLETPTETEAPALTLTPAIIPVQADEPPPDQDMDDPTKRKAPEDDDEPQPEGKRQGPKTPATLRDTNPTDTGTQGPALHLLSAASVANSELMELQPGYTVTTCTLLAKAWNSICPPQSILGPSETAADILQNARKAEQLLRQACDAETEDTALGCDPAAARTALEAVHLAATLQKGAQPHSDADQQTAEETL